GRPARSAQAAAAQRNCLAWRSREGKRAGARGAAHASGRAHGLTPAQRTAQSPRTAPAEPLHNAHNPQLTQGARTMTSSAMTTKQTGQTKQPPIIIERIL